MIITIVTPTLNGEEFLPACIESVRGQLAPGVAIEHVIVDGGSTDGTLELAEQAGCTIVGGKDTGIFDAANKGYRAASGDVFGFLGCDDQLLPGSAAAIAGWYHERDTEWAVGALRWIDASGRWLGDIQSKKAVDSTPTNDAVIRIREL